MSQNILSNTVGIQKTFKIPVTYLFGYFAKYDERKFSI